jgi:hypothetical protein
VPTGKTTSVKKRVQSPNITVVAAIDYDNIYSYMVIDGSCTWELFTLFIIITANLLRSINRLD